MKLEPERNITPTCPLNARVLRHRTLSRMLAVSFLALAGVCVISALLYQTGWAGRFVYSAGSFVVGSFAVLGNVIACGPTFRRLAMRRMIAESNAEQDQQLLQIAEEIQTPSYRDCLLSFLRLKQNIENAMHRDGELSDSVERFEVLVDEIIDSICWELKSLDALKGVLTPTMMKGESTELEKLTEEQSERYDRVMRAFTSLQSTSRQFFALEEEIVVRSHQSIDRAERLEAAIQELDSVNRIAERIENELPSGDC